LSEPGNVAVVRDAFSRFVDGDLDGLFEMVHPEAEFVPVFLPGAYRGRESIREVFEGAGTQLGWEVSDLAFEELGERILVSGQLHSTNTFGTPQEFPIAWVFEVGDGLLVSMRAFVDRRQALDELA
jgi:ketosteroid isomerase-like protein